MGSGTGNAVPSPPPELQIANFLCSSVVLVIRAADCVTRGMGWMHVPFVGLGMRVLFCTLEKNQDVSWGGELGKCCVPRGWRSQSHPCLHLFNSVRGLMNR